MEIPSLNKQQEFTLASVTDLTSPSSSLSSSPVVATFSCVNEVKELRFQESKSSDGFSFDLSSTQVALDSIYNLHFFWLKNLL
jgi:histone-arginine methyltransferase CARM1